MSRVCGRCRCRGGDDHGGVRTGGRVERLRLRTHTLAAERCGLVDFGVWAAFVIRSPRRFPSLRSTHRLPLQSAPQVDFSALSPTYCHSTCRRYLSHRGYVCRRGSDFPAYQRCPAPGTLLPRQARLSFFSDALGQRIRTFFGYHPIPITITVHLVLSASACNQSVPSTSTVQTLRPLSLFPPSRARPEALDIGDRHNSAPTTDSTVIPLASRY